MITSSHNCCCRFFCVLSTKGRRVKGPKVQGPKGQGSKGRRVEGSRVQGPKGPRVKSPRGEWSRVQESKGRRAKDPRVEGSKAQGTKGPRVQGSMGQCCNNSTRRFIRIIILKRTRLIFRVCSCGVSLAKAPFLSRQRPLRTQICYICITLTNDISFAKAELLHMQTSCVSIALASE